MTLTIKPVDPCFVQQVWPQVSGYIGAALTDGCPYPDWSHDYTLDHVQGFLATGMWSLLVALDEAGNLQGAGTVAFANTPIHRIAIITTTGGKFLTGTDVVDQVREFARANGATKLQAYARPSMVRLLQRSGYEPRNTLVEMQV
jgi:hypothetical protein